MTIIDFKSAKKKIANKKEKGNLSLLERYLYKTIDEYSNVNAEIPTVPEMEASLYRSTKSISTRYTKGMFGDEKSLMSVKHGSSLVMIPLDDIPSVDYSLLELVKMSMERIKLMQEYSHCECYMEYLRIKDEGYNNITTHLNRATVVYQIYLTIKHFFTSSMRTSLVGSEKESVKSIICDHKLGDYLYMTVGEYSVTNIKVSVFDKSGKRIVRWSVPIGSDKSLVNYSILIANELNKSVKLWNGVMEV